MENQYKYFLIEASEILVNLTKDLLKLEKEPENLSLVENIYRQVHKIKGAAGMVRLSVFTKISHQIEDHLTLFKDNPLIITSKHISLLLDAVSILEEMVSALKQGKTEESVNTSKICKSLEIDNLSDLLDKDNNIQVLHADENQKTIIKTSINNSHKKSVSSIPDVVDTRSKSKMTDTMRINTADIDLLTKLSNEIQINIRSMSDFTSNLSILKKRRIYGQSNTEERIAISPETKALIDEIENSIKNLERNIKYSTELSIEQTSLIRNFQILSLNDFTYLFEKVVRDVSETFGKKINFILEGSHIELDRSLFEKIKEPIIHILKNSIIHGIEKELERELKGKDRKGLIRLSFEKDLTYIYITCYDDGNGLDARMIKEKAVEEKIIDLETAETIKDEEALYLILKSGFSSSESLTEYAGRGVGLDVVNDCVTGLGGEINIHSEKGKFSIFTLKLPLATDILKVFTCMVSNQHLLFPLQKVIETRIVPHESIEFVAGSYVIPFNGSPIPLVYLSDYIDISSTSKPSSNKEVIIIRNNVDTIALIVDKLIGRMEVIPRQLTGNLKNIAHLHATTILSNGNPAFILDIPILIERIKTLTVRKKETTVEKQMPSIMVVDDSMTTRTLIEGILLSDGYNTFTAKSGEDALSFMENNIYDLYIIDVEMPGINGFELTKKIRQSTQHSETPIIILSSHGSDDDIRQGINARADAYIVKGEFDHDEFLTTVKSLII